MKRGELAIKGSMIGITSQLINLAAKFIVRTFTIRFLGKEILGLDSVLIDTISMLSLADLGITSAMLYRLYAPVINQDRQRVSSLMATYKKIYHCISIIILIIGIAISFFLPYIIKDISITWRTIYIAYYLQLFCSASSYFLAYKRILLDADQKRHIALIIDLITNVIFSLSKIAVIVVYKNYELYLIQNILQTIFSNIIVHIYCTKEYPFLIDKSKSLKSDIKILMSDTKDVMASKLASYVYSSTDNLIISIFLGTGVVGLISNYKYIAKALSNMLNSTMTTILPLIGNYLNSDIDKEKSFQTLNRYTYVRFFLAGITVVPFVTLANTFIILWTGDSSYLMSETITILLAIDYYISCLYGPLGEYILGMGMFKQGKYVTYVGAISNIVLSIAGVKLWGCAGVLIATVVSQLLIWGGDFYIILMKYYNSHKQYRYQYVKTETIYLFIIISCIFISLAINHFNSITNLPIKFVVGVIISELTFLIINYIVLRKTDECKYLDEIIKNMASKFKNR